ncbi:MAG: BTAD domain-containing putative transcriptional regulator [Natronosporangium sp.]
MRFEILGPLRVHADAEEIRVASSRERRVLAALLLQANRAVSTDRLVEAIWAAQPPAGARNQLQGCISRLRKQLAATGLAISTEPGGYRATVSPEDLDLLEFRRLASKARDATAIQHHSDAVAAYRAALGLWRGPALSGIDPDRVDSAARALDEEHVQAQEECIEAELAAGAAGRLVPQLTELVSEHPHREGLHRSMMLALYRAGRQADALTAYRHARTLLHDELGIEPGDDLKRLHQAILNRDPGLDHAPTARLAVRGAAGQLVLPQELPADIASFTGRSTALKTLDTLLTDGVAAPRAPIIIIGTAGVGKTALAVHWAHQVVDQFPDGQLYLNLRGHSPEEPVRPTEALPALLRSLGTPPEQIPTGEAEAAARYRSQVAGRQVLVILDNVASIEQVRPLLPGSSRCLVLVTSRNRLTGLVARDGARAVELDVFPPDEAQSLLTRFLGAERVSAEPQAATALAAACAYLPLALRIAAASLLDSPHRTIASHVARLTGVDALTTLRADGDRSSAVRGALELSYRAIPPPAQRLFRRLGLAPGADFTASAAAALAGATVETTATMLHQLASAHLIGEHVPGRYTFHDLLRLYASQLAESDDSDEERTAAVERLLHTYLRTTDNAAILLYPQMLRIPVQIPDVPTLAPLNQREDALAWLEAERSNLAAAVTLAARDRLNPPAWLLADRLRGYFWHTRHTSDWLRIAEAALAAAERGGDAPARAAAHFNVAHLYQAVAAHGEAVTHYAAACDHAEECSWTACQVAALSNIGMLYQDIGDLQRAAEHLSRSLSLDVGLTYTGGRAISHVNLGAVDRQRGRLMQAADNFARGLEINRSLSYEHGEAAAAAGLGQTRLDLGELETAHELLSLASRLFRETGDRVGETTSLHWLASIHNVAGRYEHAREAATLAVTQAQEIGDDRCQADALCALGYAQLYLGHPKRALENYRDALGLARRTKAGYSEVVAQLGVGAVQHRGGESKYSSEPVNHALKRAREIGYRVLEGQASTLLGEIYFSQRSYPEARGQATRALVIHHDTGHRLGEARTLVVLGHIQQAAGGQAEARRAWQAAYDIFTDIGSPVPDELAGRLGGR